MCLWLSKDVNIEVGVKVDFIAGWIINRGICYWFRRDVYHELYSRVGEEVYERVELEFWGGICIYKYVKNEVNDKIDESIDWGVDKSIGTKVSANDKYEGERDYGS